MKVFAVKQQWFFDTKCKSRFWKQRTKIILFKIHILSLRVRVLLLHQDYQFNFTSAFFNTDEKITVNVKRLNKRPLEKFGLMFEKLSHINGSAISTNFEFRVG